MTKIHQASIRTCFIEDQYIRKWFESSANELPTPKHCCEDIISEGYVYQILSNIDPLKAMGCDQIGPKLLKYCAVALYKPLHHVFCLSVKQGYILVNGELISLHQFINQDRSCVTNYRPISLLCTVSKFLECLVYTHLLPFVADSCPIRLSTEAFNFTTDAGFL